MSDGRQIWADIQFHAIALQESRRTILCEPHREDEVRAAVEQAGAADMFTVEGSVMCPEGKLLVMDRGAIEAGASAALQRLLRRSGSDSDGEQR